MCSPLSEEPIVTAARRESGTSSDRTRAYRFCGSSLGVVRLENLREIANLKADLVACYRAVNSEEMFALERMAIAQHIMMRAARLDAGPFTSAMNDVLDRSNDPIIPIDVDMVGDGDIEITRAQNRNYCIAEGFCRIAKESNLMNLVLRYPVQAERYYRRALKGFQRLERLRPKLPNEPNLLTEPDAADDVALLKEINRCVRDEPQNEPRPTPAAPAELFVPSAPADSAVDTTSEPPAGNDTAGGGARSQSPQVQSDRSHVLFRVRNTKPSNTNVRRGKHRGRSMPARFVSSPQPDLLPPALTDNQPKPPQ